jgi:hypothetical protein
MAKTIHTDKDPGAGIPGTTVLAAWLNKVFGHKHDGKDEDGSAPVIVHPFKEVSNTYPMDKDLDRDILADATAGAFDVTLPSLADVPIGRVVTVEKDESSANAVTVKCAGADKIETAFNDVVLTRLGDKTVLKKVSAASWKEQLPMRVKRRAKIDWTSITSITINPCTYPVPALNRSVRVASAITFIVGPGGSNADSDTPVADSMYYFCIDYSKVTSDKITETKIVGHTTAPTYDAVKDGWYVGDDLCIFGFIIDGSADLIEFTHDGGDCVFYNSYIADRNNIDLDVTWSTVTLSVPKFSTRAMITAYGDALTQGLIMIIRKKGTSGSGIQVGYLANGDFFTSTFNVPTDDSQKIEIKYNLSGTDKAGIHTNGFYLPPEM